MHRYRHLTSPRQTKEKLNTAHKVSRPSRSSGRPLKKGQWLDIFRRAKGGDTHWQDVLARWDRLIAVKREKEEMKAMLRDEFVRPASLLSCLFVLTTCMQIWQQRLRTARAILTGGYFRPSLFNRPLPRMRRQPIHVTMMIRKRRLGRERRGAKLKSLAYVREDLKLEKHFEEELQKKVAGKSGFRPVFQASQWSTYSELCCCSLLNL